MAEKTWWNGEPTAARKVWVVVGDSGQFPQYWARAEGLVGTRQPAVEVSYFAVPFYLDDRDGSGWAKVTMGHGSPHWGHSDFDAVTDVEDRDG